MRFLSKVTFGAIVAMGVVSAAQAHVREFIPYFSVAGALTYSRSTSNGLSEGDLLITSIPFDGERRTVFLEPDYEPDFDVGISFHFPQSNSRVFFNYDHFKDHKEDNVLNIRNLGLQPTINSYSLTNGHARVEHHYDEYQLGFSHNLDFHPRFYLDLLAYFEYDHLSRNFFETIEGINGQSPRVDDFGTRYTQNGVKGWGPGVGVIGHLIPHPRYSNIGIFIGAKTALLRMHNNFDQEYTFGSTLTPSSDGFYTYDPESTHSVVGKLDINFGLDYSCGIRSGMGKLFFDTSLGMRYMNMINVFKNGNAAYNPILVNPVGFAANTGYPNDWGRIGPFLQFSIGGAQA
jgi:hypothetical protein